MKSNFVKSLIANTTIENQEKIINLSIKKVQEYREKLKRNEKLSHYEQMFLDHMGDSVDSHLKMNKTKSQIKHTKNNVIISLDCPHCKLFGCYDVEKGVDSVLKCRSCNEQFRIRGDKF